MNNGLTRAAEVSQIYWKLHKSGDPDASSFMRWAEANRIWALTDDEFAAFKARLLKDG